MPDFHPLRKKQHVTACYAGQPVSIELPIALALLIVVVMDLRGHASERPTDSGIFILIEIGQGSASCRLQGAEAGSRQQDNAGFICNPKQQFRRRGWRKTMSERVWRPSGSGLQTRGRYDHDSGNTARHCGSGRHQPMFRQQRRSPRR